MIYIKININENLTTLCKKLFCKIESDSHSTLSEVPFN
jgi:hypothetical protein